MKIWTGLDLKGLEETRIFLRYLEKIKRIKEIKRVLFDVRFRSNGFICCFKSQL